MKAFGKLFLKTERVKNKKKRQSYGNVDKVESRDLTIPQSQKGLFFGLWLDF